MWDEPHYLAESLRDVRLKFEDKPGMTLPGWPGYRTRPGRSGYDPIDYQIEAYHILGRVMKMAVTGSYYTQKPFYIFLIWLFGWYGLTTLFSFLLIPVSFLLSLIINSTSDVLYSLLFLLPTLIITNGFVRYLLRPKDNLEEEEEAESDM